MNNNLNTYWGNTHAHTYSGNTELAFLRSILSKIRTKKKTVNSVIISKTAKINLHSNLATKLIYKIPNPHPLTYQILYSLTCTAPCGTLRNFAFPPSLCLLRKQANIKLAIKSYLYFFYILLTGISLFPFLLPLCLDCYQFNFTITEGYNFYLFIVFLFQLSQLQTSKFLQYLFDHINFTFK